MCVNIIYVCICLYCVICLILYYRSLLICTNKEFMNIYNRHTTDIQRTYNHIHIFLLLLFFPYIFISGMDAHRLKLHIYYNN